MNSLKEFYDTVPSITFNPVKWGAGEWAVVTPLLLHWVQCAAYETFDYFGWFQQHKMLRPEEFQKNLVTKWQVVRGVLQNHLLMMVIGFIASAYEGDITDQPIDDPLGITQVVLNFAENSEWSLVRHWPAGRLFVRFGLFLARLAAAIVVYDTWQFWAHYFFHTSWLFRNVHLWHHLLYAPWSYGATYIHPFESLMMDGIGPTLTQVIVGLNHYERTAFFVVSMVKTVDDHSGYRFPWNIYMENLTGAAAVYHTIHHQHWGLKKNYALWFTFWDVWMGTLYHGPKNLNMLPQQTDSQEPGKSAEPQPNSKREMPDVKFSTGHSVNVNGTVLLRA